MLNSQDTAVLKKIENLLLFINLVIYAYVMKLKYRLLV